jgi:hypothetical protein
MIWLFRDRSLVKPKEMVKYPANKTRANIAKKRGREKNPKIAGSLEGLKRMTAPIMLRIIKTIDGRFFNIDNTIEI